MILRLFIAALLGGAIGIEREFRAKSAGFRTHFLVALGSCLFMILSQYGFEQILSLHSQAKDLSLDPSRIASQVVTGIGFIGAGTIIFQKNMVKGLTTAAGLWVSSAIGLTCGSGLFLLSVAATLLALICLEGVFWLTHRLGKRAISITFSSSDREKIIGITERLKADNIKIDNYSLSHTPTPHSTIYTISLEIKVKVGWYESNAPTFLREFDGVEIERID